MTSTSTGFSGGGGSGAGGPVGGAGGSGASGGGPEGCNDGVVVLGEDCEDGNNLAGDGCEGCEFVSECGNGTFEPTEECDPPAVGACSAACKAEPGTPCDLATDFDFGEHPNETVATTAPLSPFAVPTLIDTFDFAFGCAATDGSFPTQLYRLPIGPYPEGLYAKVKHKGSTEPVLSVYHGCGSPLRCAKSGIGVDDVVAVTPVMPPGSVLLIGVGDQAGGGDYELDTWPHRYWSNFDAASDWLVDAAGWSNAGSELTAANLSDADGFMITSPWIFVGALDSFEIVYRGGITNANVEVEVSFDGVTFEQTVDLSLGSVASPVWDRLPFENPNDDLFVQVRLRYVSTDIGGFARLLAFRLQPVATFDTW